MWTKKGSWGLRAISIALVTAAHAAAQVAPPPRTANNNGNVQIIPVSFKNEQVAATVNGDKILVGDVKKILDQRPYPLTLTEEQKKQIRQAALDVLVEDALMRQYLTKHVPQVSQADFNQELSGLHEDLKKEKKSMADFLKETGQSAEQLQKDIIARLRWKSLLARYYPDDKAKSYYDANKPFFDKVFVRASHILIKLDAKATKEQRDRAVQQLLVWRQDIVSGKARFDDVARKHSDCPSKKKGGDIEKFPYKFVVVPQFSDTAFALKVGDVSQPVQTAFGVHLIKVTERTKGEPSTFEAVKNSVREVMAQDDELYPRILAEQRKNGAIKIELP